MRIKTDSTLLFIGDSITDCGRARPVGTHKSGLGNGYVILVESLLNIAYPERSIRVLNTGISGNTVLDLKARWQEDVLEHDPDCLSIMIGINDVWRQFDNPLEKQIHIDADLYRTTYDTLIGQTDVDSLVILSPYYLETNPDDPMRKMMDQYGEIAAQIAEKHEGIFVDIQAAFDRLMENIPSQMIAGDRVHPDTTGHMTIASAFLNGIDFEWEKLQTQ